MSKMFALFALCLLFSVSWAQTDPNVTQVALLAADSLSSEKLVYRVDRVDESQVNGSRMELSGVFSADNGVSLLSII